MGNENTTPERHVSFSSRDPNDGGYGSPRSSFRDPNRFDDRDSYDIHGPQTRSRESTFSLGQRIQDRAQRQKTVDTVDELLEDHRTKQRPKEWLHYDDVEDIVDMDQRGQQPRQFQRPPLRTFGRPKMTEEPWYEDGYDAAPFHSTRRQVMVAPNNRATTTTTYYPPNSRTTRSYHSTDFHEPRSQSRVFNTRDPNDTWYHYRPVVNRKADWALVGRHVLRPASAAVATSAVPSRLFYDNDSASSDPTSNRGRRGTGSGLVRRTDNPRVQRGTRTVYWEEEDDGADARWPGHTTYRYQRPSNIVYQNYRR